VLRKETVPELQSPTGMRDIQGQSEMNGQTQDPYNDYKEQVLQFEQLGYADVESNEYKAAIWLFQQMQICARLQQTVKMTGMD